MSGAITDTYHGHVLITEEEVAAGDLVHGLQEKMRAVPATSGEFKSEVQITDYSPYSTAWINWLKHPKKNIAGLAPLARFCECGDVQNIDLYAEAVKALFCLYKRPGHEMLIFQAYKIRLVLQKEGLLVPLIEIKTKDGDTVPYDDLTFLGGNNKVVVRIRFDAAEQGCAMSFVPYQEARELMQDKQEKLRSWSETLAAGIKVLQ